VPDSDDRRPTLRELSAAAAHGPPFDDTFLDALRTDPRAGAQQLLRKCERITATIHESLARAERMLEFEREARKAGYTRIAGVDEAGRGPLAGPIVAAAVVLNDNPPQGLDDSKRLTTAQREALFAQLQHEDHAIGVSIISAEEIDANGIQPANYKSMLDAATALSTPPDFLLVDGFQLPECPWSQRRLIKGDRRSASIAAASIIAKVTRDRIMEEFDVQYPEYGFARHKGYGTEQHLEALAEYGPCPIHRRSFTLGTREASKPSACDAT